MNPLGGLVALLGVVLILIGISGTQRNVAQALRGARPTGSGGTSPAAGGGSSSSGAGPFNKGQQATQGDPGAIFGPAPVQPPVVAPPVNTGGGLSA